MKIKIKGTIIDGVKVPECKTCGYDLLSHKGYTLYCFVCKEYAPESDKTDKPATFEFD